MIPGVIQIEVSHARLMLERARSTVLGLVLADLLLVRVETLSSEIVHAVGSGC